MVVSKAVNSVVKTALLMVAQMEGERAGWKVTQMALKKEEKLEV